MKQRIEKIVVFSISFMIVCSLLFSSLHVANGVGTLAVSIAPASVAMDLGQSQLFNSTVSSGKSPYSYRWYLDNGSGLGNVIVNPGFETGDFTGWNQEGNLCIAGLEYHTGNYSCKPLASGGLCLPFKLTQKLPKAPINSVTNIGCWYKYGSPYDWLLVNYTDGSVSSIGLGASGVAYTWTYMTLNLIANKTVDSLIIERTVSFGTVIFIDDVQFIVNGFPVSGATSSTWTFKPTHVGSYVVCLQVTDNANLSINSNFATVTANQVPFVTVSPKSVEMAIYQSQSFISTISDGTSPYYYQWYLNESKVSGATGSAWTFIPPSIGSFSVHVTALDSAGVQATSNTALTRVYTLINRSIFSDGFESGSFSAWSGTKKKAGETVSINSTYTHQGNFSAQFCSNGLASSEYAYCYKMINPVGELYARAYFKITASGISNSSDNRFSLIVFKVNGNVYAWAGWRETSKGVRWYLRIFDGNAPTGFDIVYSSSTPSVNRWYCVELHWFGDPVNGSAHLFVDGDLVCSVMGKYTSYDASVWGINEVDFGIAAEINCRSTTVYLDSAAISTAYIGLLPHDEWFASVNYLPIDSDGDGYYEGVTIRINVDTSEPTANVTVIGSYYYHNDVYNEVEGDWLYPHPNTWTVQDKTVEYYYFGFRGSTFFSYIACGGLFSFNFSLYDNMGKLKDYHFDPNAMYLNSKGIDNPLVFSDGFEHGNFSLESGVKTTPGETASVTRELPHAGNYSAKFTTNGDGEYESSYCYWVGGHPPYDEYDVVAAGAYFNVAASGIKENMDRFSLIQIEVSGKVIASAGWRSVNGTVRWSLVLWNGTNWVTALSNDTPSTGQWYHVELYCGQYGGSPGLWNVGEGASLWVNGVQVCKITDVNTVLPITRYDFGLPQTVNCGNTTVFVDQAVVLWKYAGIT